MKTSNKLPILTKEDIMDTFSNNLRKKRREKGYTQIQLAEMLGVTLRTYRSWEKNTLPKTLELINLSNILECDIDYLLGRLNSDTHFQEYIDRTYSLSPEAFKKLRLLKLMQRRGHVHEAIAKQWNMILEYLITTDDGNILLDQIRRYLNFENTTEHYIYHALLTGKEIRGDAERQDLNALSAIRQSLNKLNGYFNQIRAEQNLATFVHLDSHIQENDTYTKSNEKEL